MYAKPVAVVVGKYGICPKGNYCTITTTDPTPCLAGTYNPSLGGEALADCLKCDAGQYCEGTGRETPNGDCLAGFFCPQGQIASSDPANKCPLGHKCPTGSGLAQKCPTGTYQDEL
jgi:hypothetical protein